MQLIYIQAGWNVIHYAAAGGYTDLVKTLVKKGVRINKKDRVRYQNYKCQDIGLI